jgi:hypothetical protein
MSETETNAPPAPAAPPPTPEPEPAPAAAQPAPPRRRGRALPVLAALLFIALFAAVGWLWNQQMLLSRRLAEQPAVAPAPAAAPAELAGLVQRMDELDRKLAAMEQRPAPAPPAPVDLKPLEARIAALEQRQPQAAPDLGPITQKLDRIAAEAAAAKGAETDVSGRLATLEQRLAAAEQKATQLGARAAQAQLLERAQVALDNGMPLGDIEGAPPALARFAHANPPTEAALRLAFPQAAAGAERASRPSTAGQSFGERMWLRARSLITVKQGDKVLLGPPAAEVLGEAQARLDAGDLAGAVAALARLDGPAAQAMAPWRSQAQALLDARAALATMARS